MGGADDNASIDVLARLLLELVGMLAMLWFIVVIVVVCCVFGRLVNAAAQRGGLGLALSVLLTSSTKAQAPDSLSTARNAGRADAEEPRPLNRHVYICGPGFFASYFWKVIFSDFDGEGT